MGNIVPEGDGTERLPNPGELVAIGQWYWVKGKDGEWFGCVTAVGSNYAELSEPCVHGSSHCRVHFDEFDAVCRPEPDPEKVIRGEIETKQKIVEAKLGAIRELTHRLGMEKAKEDANSSTRALAVLSGSDDVKKYKKALVKARDKELPKLFEEVKKATEELNRWLMAQALPIEGLAASMEGAVEVVKDRIFTVSLYAGLTEEVVEIAKGRPADMGDKLHIFQRLHYMDEECLANYKHGGLRFKHLKEFDRWLAESENRKRILPFPRSMVAFRVRRGTVEGGFGGMHVAQIMVELGEREFDKLTFLYIRNGEQLYRLNCDLEFGEYIYPSEDELKRRLDFSEPMMTCIDWGEVKDIVTKSHYEELVAENARRIEEEAKKAEEWKKANPDKEDLWNPHRSFGYDYRKRELDKYEPFDSKSVHFDEMKEEIENRIKQYNRIILIVQGLFDRSEVLHPHQPARLWDPAAFGNVIELMRCDGLYHGAKPPDFEAYLARCNAGLDAGSLTIGQEDYWERKEAEKENERRRNNWRWANTGQRDLEHHSPYGNPGPGYIARVAKWSSRLKRATFKWDRQRQYSTWNHDYGEPIPTSVSVPADKLFNVSAYQLGDYKQFFADPRTRAQYIKWAPMLIAAEEYHANPKKAQIGPKDES